MKSVHSQRQVLEIQLFQMQSMHWQIHFFGSFEESYLLQPYVHNVLVIQNILFVNFAAKLPDFLGVWRTTIIEYMHLKSDCTQRQVLVLQMFQMQRMYCGHKKHILVSLGRWVPEHKLSDSPGGGITL